MKRFVCIRRRILNHHQWRSFGSFHQTILFVSLNFIQQIDPRSRCDSQVQETFYHIKSCYCRFVHLQIFTDFLRRLFRSFSWHFQKREHDQRQMSFKFFFGLLDLHHFFRDFLTVECFQSANDGRYKFIFYLHNQVVSCAQRYKKRRRTRLPLLISFNYMFIQQLQTIQHQL